MNRLLILLALVEPMEQQVQAAAPVVAVVVMAHKATQLVEVVLLLLDMYLKQLLHN